MSISTDLLGDRIAFHGLHPRTRARRLYELADRAPPGSAERAALYRDAAAAQRQAEAADELQRHRVAQRQGRGLALRARSVGA